MLSGESNRRSLRMRVMLFFAWMFLVLALIAGGIEAMNSFKAAKWVLLTPGELWYRFDVSSLNLSQAVVQRYLHPAIWEPGIASILRAPSWVVLLVLAVIFRLFAIRRRRKRGGMDRFRRGDIEN